MDNFSGLLKSCYGWEVYETTAKYAYIRLWHYIVDNHLVNESERFYKLSLNNLKIINVLSQNFSYMEDSEGMGVLKSTLQMKLYIMTHRNKLTIG